MGFKAGIFFVQAAGLAYHNAPACIFLRLDDIQCYALVIYRNKLRMIYTPMTWWGREGSNLNKKAQKYLFLFNPKDWHGITARSAVYIISPCGAVSHHASACILPAAWCKERSDGIASLRASIQWSALMIYRNKLRMIYTPSAWCGCKTSKISWIISWIIYWNMI